MSYIIEDRSSSELANVLEQEVKRLPGNVVVHSGHFFLEIVDNCVVDHLGDPANAKPAFQELISFTQHTWEAACKIVSSAGSQHKLIILANDWQYCVPKEVDRRRRESLAAQLRCEYYERTPLIPSFHLDIMHRYGLSQDHILPASEESFLFSESRLRSNFATTTKELTKDPGRAERLGLSKRLRDDQNPVISTEVDGQEIELLYCGNTGCAGEVVELLKQLYNAGVRSFVNVYPWQCDRPVETGTSIAKQLFGLDGMEVVNIAVR